MAELVSWLPSIGGALGAFSAAWLGAFLGFRRSRKERALDKNVGWHEQAIQSLAQYEEQLERIRGYAFHVSIVKPALDKKAGLKVASDKPWTDSVKVPAHLWKELREIETAARAKLRLADLYTDTRLAIDCSVALKGTVNMVSNEWIDVGDEPTVSQSSFSAKASATATLRGKLQESLRVVLEVDGFLSGLLGSRYRRWLKVRKIERLRRDYLREQEAAREAAGKSLDAGS